jgi:hypothetical protein
MGRQNDARHALPPSSRCLGAADREKRSASCWQRVVVRLCGGCTRRAPRARATSIESRWRLAIVRVHGHASTVRRASFQAVLSIIGGGMGSCKLTTWVVSLLST